MRLFCLALSLCSCSRSEEIGSNGGPQDASPMVDLTPVSHDGGGSWPDMPAPNDLTPMETYCPTPPGRKCPTELSCADDVGCNVCDCRNQGQQYACSLVACFADMGTRPEGAPPAPRCRDDLDCGGAFGHCVFDEG